jgi:hypothetical protein
MLFGWPFDDLSLYYGWELLTDGRFRWRFSSCLREIVESLNTNTQHVIAGAFPPIRG